MMFVFSLRATALLAVVASFGLTSCSRQTAGERVGTPAFYWSAAKETYAAGDYMKTADHLDHLISGQNEYTARALPWSLVLTSGMAAGYMELADDYTAGAHMHKVDPLVFYKKASEYRNTASRLALRFAENVEKLDQLPAGQIALAFPLPKGTAAVPGVIAKIAGGIELPKEDADEALSLTIERNVLLAACLAAGSPNDAAKTMDLLSRDSASVSRPLFAKAIAHMLERESTMYVRDKLDEPEKLAILKQRAQSVLSNPGNADSAMIVKTSAR